MTDTEGFTLPPPNEDTSAARHGGRLSVVIVNYRTANLTIDCLLALAKERERGVCFDAIVVDGCSDDGSVGAIKHAIKLYFLESWVEVLPMSFNGGFGWANNQAITRLLKREIPPELIYFVNPDAIVYANSITRLVEELQRSPDIAAAGSLLVDANDRPLGSAFAFPGLISEFFRAASTPILERLLGVRPKMVESAEVCLADWVTGASVMLQVNALRDVGLFDEGFFLYFEEVELMLRMRRAGWRIVHVPDSRVRHVGGAATGIGDESHAPRRLPDYWFQSRRRFLTLAYGRVTASLASISWIMGLMVWRARCIFGLGRASSHAPFELRDLLRNGIIPTVTDQRMAAPAWDSPPSTRPAWNDRL